MLKQYQLIINQTLASQLCRPSCKTIELIGSRPQDSAAFSDVISGLFWPPAETGGLFQSIETEGKAASL